MTTLAHTFTPEQWIGLGVMLLGGAIFFPGLAQRFVAWVDNRAWERHVATMPTDTPVYERLAWETGLFARTQDELEFAASVWADIDELDEFGGAM